MSRTPHILFVAAREPSYPRVAMTLKALQSRYHVDVITCESKSYPRRLLEVSLRFALRRKRRYDAVFLGFFAQPLMPLVCLVWRGPLVVDAFISLYDSLVLDKGLVSAKGVVGNVALTLDRFTLRHADVALVDTIQHQALFESLNDGDKLPSFHRIWAGAEADIFPRLSERPYDPASDAPFEVLFWGAFIPLQGVEVIVKAAALLAERPIRFTLVGLGQTYANCVRLAESLHLRHVNFVGWKRPSELTALADRSHLLLGIFGQTEKAKRVIPNKAFQALALGKPLLTGRSAALFELLTEGHDVLACAMNDPAALAEAIVHARDHYDSAMAIGRNGHETFLAHCSDERRAEEVSEALAEVTRDRTPE